jgi:hypothetical protein
VDDIIRGFFFDGNEFNRDRLFSFLDFGFAGFAAA